MKHKSVMSLKQYKKLSDQSKKPIIISLALRQDQIEFLEKHELNRSDLFRDLLDQFIKSNK